jgi:hypothetical protein
MDAAIQAKTDPAAATTMARAGTKHSTQANARTVKALAMAFRALILLVEYESPYAGLSSV